MQRTRCRSGWGCESKIGLNGWGAVSDTEWYARRPEDRREKKPQKAQQFMVRSTDFILGATAAAG